MPFATRPVPASMAGPSCQVQMTKAQADLIHRAMALFLDKAVGLLPDEREEAQAIADMAAEFDPEMINGWDL